MKCLLDIVDNIKNFKRKKPDKEFMISDACTLLGLTEDEATTALENLVQEGMISFQEETVCVDYKKKFDLTRSIAISLRESSIPKEHSSISTQTDHHVEADPIQQTQVSSLRPLGLPSDNIGIYDSFAKLAASFVESQKIIQNEREHNRILLQENVELKTESLHRNDNPTNSGQNVSIEQKASIVTEDTRSELSQNIKEQRTKGTHDKRKRKAKKNKAETKTTIQEVSTDNDNAETSIQEIQNHTNTAHTAAEGITASLKPAFPNNEILNAPKNTTATKGAASCDSANGNLNDGNQREPVSLEPGALRSQRGVTAATSRKADKKRSGVILGDSMVKHIYGWEMKEKCGDNGNIYVKSFPGATTKDMYSYAQPSIERKPGIAVLHVGTNDLVQRRDEEMQSEVEIAQGIIDLAEHIRSHDIEVVVSGIIARGEISLDRRREKVNFILEDLCSEKKLNFINHCNIEATKHLNRSKLHLNNLGDTILTNNLLNSLRF